MRLDDHGLAVDVLADTLRQVRAACPSPVEEVLGQALALLEEDQELRGRWTRHRRPKCWEAAHVAALASPYAERSA